MSERKKVVHHSASEKVEKPKEVERPKECVGILCNEGSNLVFKIDAKQCPREIKESLFDQKPMVIRVQKDEKP